LAIDLMNLVIQIIISIIVLAPVLWIVGRSLVGKEKARGSDAIWIVILGVVLQSVVGALFSGIVGFILTLLVWLVLIHHFFDCGWLMAFAIAVVTIIVFIVILVIIGIVLGVGLLFLTGII